MDEMPTQRRRWFRLAPDHLVVGLLLMACVVCSMPLAVLAADAQEKSGEPSPTKLLREASRIAALQNEQQTFWTDTTLLEIGEVQRRARDFEGAHISIRASPYESGRDSEFVELANALATAGQLNQAVDVLHEIRRRPKRDRAAAVRIRITTASYCTGWTT